MEILSRRKKCPKCGKGTLQRRVRRHQLVKLMLFWLPLKRYKCDMCYAKSYILGDVRQGLFMVEVNSDQRIILLERLQPGLSINTLNTNEKMALKRSLNDGYPKPMPASQYTDCIIESDYTGEYIFGDDADVFLRKVIEQSAEQPFQKMY